MRFSRYLVAGLLALALTVPGSAADPVKHRIMFAEYGKGPNRLVELDADGKVSWEHKFPSITVIFQPQADGRVVYAYGGSPTGVCEIDRDQKRVWNYESKSPQVLGCDRTAEGTTLIAEQGPPRVLEVDKDGKVLKTTPLTTSEKNHHLQVRSVHKLANGNILACHEGEGAVREYAPDGKVVWEYTGVPNNGNAVRLANGNTLISGATTKKLFEVSPEKKIVWEFGPADAPELNLTWITNIQVLKNGNYVVGNFLRNAEGKGAHAFEITRDKKVVWTFADHKLAQSITTVRVLDDK